MTKKTNRFNVDWQDGYSRVWLGYYGDDGKLAGARWVYYTEIKELISKRKEFEE